MEYNLPIQSFAPSPLPLERQEKLKIFAIVGTRKDVVKETIKGESVLSMLAAYTEAEAMVVFQQQIKAKGLNIEEYIIPFMKVVTDADKIISAPVETLERKISVVVPPPVKQKEKSIEDIAAYVLYVFDKVGTPVQKKIADIVIKKFKNGKSK